MKYKLLLIFSSLFINSVFAQQSSLRKDNSFKIVASMTGLGAAYEFNTAKVFYVQAGITSTFTVTRINAQAKLRFFAKDNFKIKGGVEAAYLSGDFKVGNVFIDYPSPVAFMPMVSFDWKIIGIEIPVLIEPGFKRVMPILGITLNVSKDDVLRDEYGRPISKQKKKKKKKSDDED